ncbi:MAG: hypothetical protein ABIG44_00460 [Planctomycetota bacterium]
MRYFLLVMIICLFVCPANGQALQKDEKDEPQKMSRLRQNVGRLLESFQGLSDWETHSGYMLDAMEKVYARNAWDTESDLFSLDLIREINTVPPWEMQERFDTLIGAVSDRYLLDADQEQNLRITAIRESNELFQVHSTRIMQYAVEAIQARAAGEPFTAEKVARWAELARPVYMDTRTRMNAAATRFMADLDPDQQALMREDLQALNHRLDDVDELGQRWERGEWDPSDWGLEEDPIQLAGQAQAAEKEVASSDADKSPEKTVQTPRTTRQVTTRKPPRAAPASRVQPTARSTAQQGKPPTPGNTEKAKASTDSAAKPSKASGSPNDPWAQYVERFIAKYKLDESQQARAWKIYRDVQARGDKLRKRYDQLTETAHRRDKPTEKSPAGTDVRPIESKRDDDLNRLFEQMKRRLERLPTRTQRRDATPGDLDKPARKVHQPVNPVENDGP